MHFIVIIRHIFFVLAILSLISLTVLSFLGIRNSVVLSPGLSFLSFSMTVYLSTIFVFDFVRIRNGFGYRFFVFKIWWELVSLSTFTIITIILIGVGITKPQGALCFHYQTGDANLQRHVCVISNGIWTAEILVAILFFSYVIFLGVVAIEYYQRTPSVLYSGVIDFNWDAKLAPRPYHLNTGSFDSYPGGNYTVDSKPRREMKSRLMSTYDISSPIPRDETSTRFSTKVPVTFPDIRKMKPAHTHPGQGSSGSRFVEHLDPWN